MRRTTIACVVFLLPSCGLFSEIDATPVAEISDARHQISEWKTAVTMRIVRDPANGLDPKVRLDIETAWKNADTAESDLHRAQLRLAESFGTVSAERTLDSLDRILTSVDTLK